MSKHNLRDKVTVEDEKGNIKNYNVEALFDMDENNYALLSNKEETVLMRVEGEDLFDATPDEKQAISDAYNIAVNSLPKEEQSELRT